MTSAITVTPDPNLDLVLDRVVDVPPELLWEAWTKPEHVQKWFAPDPWSIGTCEIDLRPGGIFRADLRSPDGEVYPNISCILEVVTNERLAWTVALQPGYRPSENDAGGPSFTAVLNFERQGQGTHYTAIAVHRDEAGRKQHEEMGFQEGWGMVFDQLVAYVKANLS